MRHATRFCLHEAFRRYMSGLDTLIARSLDSTIKENLGKKTLEKVEQRLFEKYGINLTQSIEDFTKLDTVLREFFGGGAEGLWRLPRASALCQGQGGIRSVHGRTACPAARIADR